MNEGFMKINNKTVQLSEPYNARMSDLIGREHEMKKILSAWISGGATLPLSPLLLGDAGIGKNRIVYECAGMCSKELYIIQGHEDVSAEDLICTVRFSDDPNKKMDYIVSALVTAMVRGAVCFIDEIAKIRLRALAPLASVLDERRYIDSNILGERIYAHPGFRFIAATNSIDLESGLLPDFIRSRMRPVIKIGHPQREEIDMIVKSQFHALQCNGNSLLDKFWELWGERCKDKPPTPRDSIYIFGFAFNLANFEAIKDARPYLLECNSITTIKTGHLEKAFDAFYDSF